MSDLVHSPMNAGEWVGIIVVLSILGGVLISVVAILTDYFRRLQLDEMDATLKIEMIQRGMSADEIATVLQARSGRKRAYSNDFEGIEATGDKHACRSARRAMREAMRAAREQHRPA